MKLPAELQEIVAHDDSIKRKRSLKILLPFGPLLRWGFWGVLFLMLMSINGRLGKLQTKEAPSLVQMADGSGIAVQAKPSSYRDPKIINQFINEWLALALNWDNKIIGADGKEIKDKGLPVEGSIVPTGPVVASYAMADDFGQQWLLSIVNDKKYPISRYMDGAESRLIVPKYISEPKELGPGLYQVDVVGAWYDIKAGDQSGLLFPYRKTFVLKAINAPVQVLKDAAPPFQKAVYSVLSKGLQVETIKSFAPQ